MENEKEASIPAFRAVSCSGASNAGAIADMVVRRLDEELFVNMNCLTKIAIGDRQLTEKYSAAGKHAIAVDGCPVHCAKKILEAAGITGFTHFTITEMGVKKGETPVTQETIDHIATTVKTRVLQINGVTV